MNLLILHHECEYFGGAEKMLLYFSEALLARKVEFGVALVQGSRLDLELSQSIPRVYVSQRSQFSVTQLIRQFREISRAKTQHSIQLIHAWAARDFELGALASRLLGLPCVGLLHDHPQSHYLSGLRQKLMRFSANTGFSRLVCVSNAVKEACKSAGYDLKKLEVIQNGLVFPAVPPAKTTFPRLRAGFLGTFSKGKGLDGIFEMMATGDLGNRIELIIGGDVSCDEDRVWFETVKLRYEKSQWWPRIQWKGWVRDLDAYFAEINLLIFSSRMFDSFPTVLLEAARASVPSLAVRVGGAAEIVEDGKSGWLFESGQWAEGGGILSRLAQDPAKVENSGREAFLRCRERFEMNKMVDKYSKLYSILGLHV
jgi:glycosyltransferase involved in cell wall biosynthesis